MSNTLPSELAATLQETLHDAPTQATPVSGGCIHQALRVELSSGRSVFLKHNQAQAADNFRVEALGLELLREVGALRVPEVLDQGVAGSKAYLLLSWVESGRAADDYWEKFGQGLAQQHQHSNSQFGLDHDNYIGSLPQSNQPQARWSEFFVQQRLQPMVQRARQQGLLDQQLLRKFEQLYPRLPELFPDEPPALLHGDLWGGNIRTGPDGQAVILDPAVYYGHREMELAFMTLFDRQPPAFYEAYEAVWPLSPGWRERQDLCNLYPLLVHVNLFGRGYLGATQQALQRYL